MTIFCARGGGGSTALIEGIKSCGKKCAIRPDVVFYDIYKNKYKYDESPSNRDIKEFYDRSGYKLNKTFSIKHNLHNYMKFINRSENCVVFNALFIKRMLSSYDIRNVIFLIRNPFDGYASWIKPERHLDVAKKLGGIYSEKTYYTYAFLWNSLVEEYFNCTDLGLHPILIRYETAKEDAHFFGMDEIFNNWRIKNKKYNFDNFKNFELYNDLVKYNFTKLLKE